MTYKEFINKYHLNYENIVTLDDLYLNYTLEQALEIINEYFKHADEIFNSIKK